MVVWSTILWLYGQMLTNWTIRTHHHICYQCLKSRQGLPITRTVQEAKLHLISIKYSELATSIFFSNLAKTKRCTFSELLITFWQLMLDPWNWLGTYFILNKNNLLTFFSSDRENICCLIITSSAAGIFALFHL